MFLAQGEARHTAQGETSDLEEFAECNLRDNTVVPRFFLASNSTWICNDKNDVVRADGGDMFCFGSCIFIFAFHCVFSYSFIFTGFADLSRCWCRVSV